MARRGRENPIKLRFASRTGLDAVQHNEWQHRRKAERTASVLPSCSNQSRRRYAKLFPVTDINFRPRVRLLQRSILLHRGAASATGLFTCEAFAQEPVHHFIKSARWGLFHFADILLLMTSLATSFGND